MCYEQPSTVSALDIQRAFAELGFMIDEEYLRFDAFEGERMPELWIGGSPIRLHLDMVESAGEFSDEEKNLIKISAAQEWAVAATIVMLRCLAPAIVVWLRNGNVYNCPVENWIPAMKKQLSWITRAGMIGDYISIEVYKLRALVNVTARADEEAEWRDDISYRTTWACPKFQPLAERPFDAYVNVLKRSVKETVAAHIRAVAKEREIEDVDRWWQSRHHTTPSGSSSLRYTVVQQLKEDSRFSGTDRPNKKAVVENLDDDWMRQCLASFPINVARLSTKKEPGLKNRPLHANDDSSYAVEAYASVHMEKALAFNAMYGKQNPADVIEWMKWQDYSLKHDCYWVSADYWNFNVEHAKWELALLNLERAKGWLELGSEEVCYEKAWACLWMGESQFESYYRFPIRQNAFDVPDEMEGESYWVHNGLNSGSRNTLQDHDYMHRAYADGATETMLQVGESDNPLYLAFVGDDEDKLAEDEVKACVYIWALQTSGHNLQASKQEGGKRDSEEDIRNCHHPTHTFLQRKACGTELPVRPLAKILATLASGNWYTEPGVWFDSCITSVSDNWWECVTRGMPLQMAQKLAIAMLDRLMVVLPEQGIDDVRTKPLEWFSFIPEHPLWENANVERLPMPDITTKPQPHHSWPRKATDAWLKKQEHILKHLRATRVEEYTNYLLRETVGTSFHHFRQRTMRDEARAFWPERIRRKYEFADRPLQEKLEWHSFMQIAIGLSQERRPVDAEEQAARVGIDIYLLNLCGAEVDLYKFLKPEAWSRFSEIVVKQNIQSIVHNADTSIRAWISAAPYYIPSLHLPGKPKKRLERIRIIHAANGAGKTFICQRFRRIVDMDVPAYKYVGWVERLERSNQGVDNMSAEAQAALYHCQLHELDTIMTQWPLHIMQDACLKFKVEAKYYTYEVAEETRRERLTARGWTPERVEENISAQNEIARKYIAVADNRMSNWTELVSLVGYRL
jgi:hypothetical protein